MKYILLLLLVVSSAYCHTVYYVHENWKYTIVLDKNNSTISAVYCPECNEDGFECEELPQDPDDIPHNDGPLQPGIITLIALTCILVVIMLLAITAAITHKYSMRQHNRRTMPAYL